jgi:hypothetical protein
MIRNRETFEIMTARRDYVGKIEDSEPAHAVLGVNRHRFQDSRAEG